MVGHGRWESGERRDVAYRTLQEVAQGVHDGSGYVERLRFGVNCFYVWL
jgi:hypothetical protein